MKRTIFYDNNHNVIVFYFNKYVSQFSEYNKLLYDDNYVHTTTTIQPNDIHISQHLSNILSSYKFYISVL